MKRARVKLTRYQCPCCGNFTLREPNRNELCSVCFWEDDGQDDPDADEVWGGPNREWSLTQARANYAEFGAIDREFIGKVRRPEPDELEHT